MTTKAEKGEEETDDFERSKEVLRIARSVLEFGENVSISAPKHNYCHFYLWYPLTMLTPKHSKIVSKIRFTIYPHLYCSHKSFNFGIHPQYKTRNCENIAFGTVSHTLSTGQ